MDIDLTHIDWTSFPSIVGAVSQLVTATELLKGVTPEARVTLVLQTLTKAIESTPLEPEMKLRAETFVADMVPHVISVVLTLLPKVEAKVEAVVAVIEARCGCLPR